MYKYTIIAAMFAALCAPIPAYAQASSCQSSYAPGTTIPPGCQPTGTMPPFLPRDGNGNLIIPTEVNPSGEPGGGITFDQFKQNTCPNPCSLTTAQLQENFATFAAFQSGGNGDPLANILGAATDTSDVGGGGGDSSCASAAGNGFGALSTMFGGNITQGIANQLVSSGVLPKEVADILSMPNAPSDRVAWAMQQLKDRGLPTNPMDLAKEQLPILGTVVNGVTQGDIIGTAISQAAQRGLPPEAVNALNFAKQEALANGGQLTQLARDALKAAGLPNTVGGLAADFGVELNIPPEVSSLAGVDNLLPSEIAEIEEALSIISDLEGLGDGDVTAEDMQKALDSLNDIGNQLGIGNLTPEDAKELLSGLNDLNDAAEKASDGDGNPGTANGGTTGEEAKPEDIDALLAAIGGDSTITSVTGGGLTAESVSSMYDDLNSLNDATGGKADVLFSNLGPISSAFTSLPGGSSPNQITQAFQGLAGLAGGAGSAQSVSAILNAAKLAPPSELQRILGPNYNQTLTSLGNLNGIQNMNLTSVSGAFAAAQKVIGSGVLDAAKLGSLSSAFKSLQDKIKLPEFASKFQNLTKVKDALAKFSKIKGLGGLSLDKLKGFSDKLKNIDLIKKVGLDKFTKMIKAPDFLKKFNNFGADKMKAALDKIKNFGPAQLQKLFSKMPKLPIDKINNLLSGGMSKVTGAINKIPGVSQIPGGAQGLISAIGSLNFSSAGCLFQSLLNKALCKDGPTAKPCAGNGQANAAQGSGQDDTYKNYCFSGPLEPRPRMAEGQENMVKEDYHMGAEGVKSKDCITHKDTETKTILSMNNYWLLLEHGADGPQIGQDGITVEGQSPYYKYSENEHKLKGALVKGRGGENTTTFGKDFRGLNCLGTSDIDCREVRRPLFPEEAAQLARLDHDACTNNYIFKLMMGKGTQVGGGDKARTEGMDFIFDSRAVRGEASYDQTWCQPFKMVPVECEPDLINPSQKCLKKRCEGGRKKPCTRNEPVDKYDYEAWKYISQAWFNVLDISYFPTRYDQIPAVAGDEQTLSRWKQQRRTDPSRGRYGGFMDEGWKALGDGMGKYAWGDVDIQLNGLIQQPYERIWDPTHPFSPRWDYSSNERMSYSPRTAAYFEFNSLCEVRCAAVPVDLMSFRHPQFAKCMNCRLGVNTAAFWGEVALQTVCPGPCIPFPTALNNTRKGISPITMPFLKTGLKNRGKWPPCNTKFDVDGGDDKEPWMCYGCVLASGTKDRNNGVRKCCSDLAKPIAPVNTLKIRSKQDMTRTPPEGYEFAKYFDDHKPYMRWWDTGGEAGSPGGHDQMSKCGASDVIVGVGTEKAGCNYGGSDGQSIKPPCIVMDKPNALSSWMELKLYQTNTFRTYRLNCIGQYEKLFKGNGGEDFVLKSLGKTFLSLDEKGQSAPRLFPESWRGYVTAKADDKRFPKPGAASGYQNAISAPYGSLPRGLDNAQVGDVLIWDKKVNASRMPQVAIVKDIMTKKNNPAIPEKEKVVVVREMNVGKYPDACGNTDAWGLGATRYLHKNCIVYEGKKAIKSSSAGPLTEEENFYEPFMKTGGIAVSPAGICYVAKKADEIAPATFSCEDSNLQACEEKDWDKIIIYRPCAAGTNNDCRN